MTISRYLNLEDIMKLLVLTFMIFLLLIPVKGSNTEDTPPMPEKKPVTYYLATYYTFDSREDFESVKEMYIEHFLPASEAMGWDVQIFYPLMMGTDYQMMILFHLQEGLVQLEWFPSKTDISFYEQMAEEVGSEAAEKMLSNMRNKIKSEKTEIIQKLQAKE